MPTEEHEVYCIEDALCRYALHILEVSKEWGWDQPASLMAVNISEEHRFDTEPSSGAVSVTFSIDHLADFEEFTPASLVGWSLPRDAVGVALVCDCWVYHPDRPPCDSQHPPSFYDDSLEVKVAHVVLRDGTEALATIYRDGEIAPSVQCARHYGFVPQAVRRVAGLPSCVREELPTVQEVRSRVLPWIGYAVLNSVRGFLHDKLLSDFQSNYAKAYHEVLMSLGLTRGTWEESLEMARRSPRGGPDSVLADLGLVEAVDWVDPPMWALTLNELIPPRAAIAASFQELVERGDMEDSARARAVEILFREEKDAQG